MGACAGCVYDATLGTGMRKAIKHIEKGLSIAANGAWRAFRVVNELIPENASFTPKWSAKPLLKSYEKVKPPLGWPRTTDSLCPRCVPEIRNEIINGKRPLRSEERRVGKEG